MAPRKQAPREDVELDNAPETTVDLSDTGATAVVEEGTSGSESHPDTLVIKDGDGSTVGEYPAKKSSKSVKVLDANGNFVREFSEEVHGKQFVELAKLFVSKTGREAFSIVTN